MLGLDTERSYRLVFFLKKAVSHMLDNQWYIWWDKAGRFLGPRRVRNGPIALLKVNDRREKQQYTKNETNLLRLSNTRGKNDSGAARTGGKVQTSNTPQELLKIQ